MKVGGCQDECATAPFKYTSYSATKYTALSPRPHHRQHQYHYSHPSFSTRIRRADSKTIVLVSFTNPASRIIISLCSQIKISLDRCLSNGLSVMLNVLLIPPPESSRDSTGTRPFSLIASSAAPLRAPDPTALPSRNYDLRSDDKTWIPQRLSYLWHSPERKAHPRLTIPHHPTPVPA